MFRYKMSDVNGLLIQIVPGPLLPAEPLRNSRSHLETYEGTLLSANNTLIPVYGQAQINVQIGNKLMRHMILMTDIANEGLISSEFIG